MLHCTLAIFKNKVLLYSYQNNNDLLKKQSTSTYYACSWHRTTSTGSSYGLKCLTSFFSEGSMLGETTLVIFLLSFRTLLGCCSVLCVGFSVHVAQQDFYYFKGYQFRGWYLSNFRFWPVTERHRKSEKCPPSKMLVSLV